MAVAAVTGLPVALDEGLREVSFGKQEGKPMVQWFNDWVAGTYTPVDAESFAALRTRAVAAINRALTAPAPVLVVAHGALFRALRAEMGLEPNVRTANAMPFFCRPGAPQGTPWELVPAAELR
jgi:probable phosphoglycerate mutase